MLAVDKVRLYNPNGRNTFPFSMEGCVLYLPFWQEDMQGSPLISYDQYHHSCSVTGAIWGTQGRTFDGSDDNINCGVVTLAGDMTVCAWVKPTTLTNYDGLVSQYGDAKGFLFDMLATGGARFVENPGAGEVSVSATAASIVAGTWECVFGWVSGTTIGIQIVGHDAVTSALGAVGGIVQSASILYAGRGYIAGKILHGIMGESIIYNRALPSEERTFYYNKTKWKYL